MYFIYSFIIYPEIGFGTLDCILRKKQRMFHFKGNLLKTSFIKHIKEEQTDKIVLTRKI